MVSTRQQIEANFHIASQQSFTYNAEKIIGNGSFGVVFKATIAETGETVAIKKVFQDKRYKNRELQILFSIVRDEVSYETDIQRVAGKSVRIFCRTIAAFGQPVLDKYPALRRVDLIIVRIVELPGGSCQARPRKLIAVCERDC